MAQEVWLREIAQLVRCETIFDAEESMVASVRTQPVEVTRQPLLVIGANCANSYGSSVAKNRARRVVR